MGSRQAALAGCRLHRAGLGVDPQDPSEEGVGDEEFLQQRFVDDAPRHPQQRIEGRGDGGDRTGFHVDPQNRVGADVGHVEIAFRAERDAADADEGRPDVDQRRLPVLGVDFVDGSRAAVGARVDDVDIAGDRFGFGAARRVGVG